MHLHLHFPYLVYTTYSHSATMISCLVSIRAFFDMLRRNCSHSSPYQCLYRQVEWSGNPAEKWESYCSILDIDRHSPRHTIHTLLHVCGWVSLVPRFVRATIIADHIIKLPLTVFHIYYCIITKFNSPLIATDLLYSDYAEFLQYYVLY